MITVVSWVLDSYMDLNISDIVLWLLNDMKVP